MSEQSVPQQRVWLVTGCSSGFGLELVHAILARGDKVIATARNIDDLVRELKSEPRASTVKLDVTQPLAELKSIAETAISIFGRVDILVNNAGYVQRGAIEECTPEETYQQFNTNLFGLLNVTRSFFPHMRARRSGIIVNIGSVAGWRGAPGVGLYAATKFALEGVTESLRAELEPLGIKVTIIEPGYFRTSVLSTTNLKQAQPISDYEPVMDRVKKFHEGYDGKQPGDPKKACERIVDIVTQSGTANGREIPVRVALGTDAYQVIGDMIDKSRSDLEAWKDVTVSTDFA